MNVRPSILCPVDYSTPSTAALRYAAALAEHFSTRLIVLSVVDPLLMAAADAGAGWQLILRPGPELASFVEETFEAEVRRMCEHDIAVGVPATEILRVARERSCDLIVMSAHGMGGPRPLECGSTTERVLRESLVPVLVTPAADPGRIRAADAGAVIGRIMVPVDLTPASGAQAAAASSLAAALALPLTFIHVLEPVSHYWSSRLRLAAFEEGRTGKAQLELSNLLATVPASVDAACLIARGDPAEEVARAARDARAGLLVMGLHDAVAGGPRRGSVTSRTLRFTQALVLALPGAMGRPRRPTPALLDRI